MQWHTGSTDHVLGSDGSPSSNTSAKEPYKIQGIEQLVGCYETLGDAILNYAQDGDGAWRQYPAICRDASKIDTSVTDDYATADYGYPCPDATNWGYIGKLGHDDNLPECMFPVVKGGSSSMLTRNGIYSEKAGTAGEREWLSFSNLTGATFGGLSGVYAAAGKGNSYWHSGGRLSVTGNRGTWKGANP
jgi:hypothetical protein